MPRRDRRDRRRQHKTKLEDLNYGELKEYVPEMATFFYDNITDNGGEFNPSTFSFPTDNSSLLFLLENKDKIKTLLTSREFIDDMGGLDPLVDVDNAVDKLFSSIESILDRDFQWTWKSYQELKNAYDGSDLYEMREIYEKFNTDRLVHRSKNFQELHKSLGEKNRRIK